MPVYNKISVYAFKNDTLVYQRPDIVNIKVDATARTANYSISPEQAIGFAAKHLSIPVSPRISMMRKDDLLKRFVYKTEGSGADSSSADLIWLPINGGKEIKLAWNVLIASPDGNDVWLVRIDAQTGEYINKNNLVVHEHAGNDVAPFQQNNFLSQIPASKVSATATSATFFTPPTVNSASYRVYSLQIFHGLKNPAITIPVMLVSLSTGNLLKGSLTSQNATLAPSIIQGDGSLDNGIVDRRIGAQ